MTAADEGAADGPGDARNGPTHEAGPTYEQGSAQVLGSTRASGSTHTTVPTRAPGPTPGADSIPASDSTRAADSVPASDSIRRPEPVPQVVPQRTDAESTWATGSTAHAANATGESSGTADSEERAGLKPGLAYRPVPTHANVDGTWGTASAVPTAEEDRGAAPAAPATTDDEPQ
jgi:hypothetical protein